MNQILPVSFVVKLAARMYKANHRHYVNIKRGPPALSLSNYESRAEPSVLPLNVDFWWERPEPKKRVHAKLKI